MSNRKYMSSFSNNYRNETGVLSKDLPSRSGGKKILEWMFTAKGAKEGIAVTVHLEQSDEGMVFSARCSKLMQSVTDSDINRLHATVQDLLLEQAQCLSQITWEDWLEVVVKGENSDFTDSKWSALGANLHIQVNKLKRGIHPVSGEPVTINCNGVVSDFPKATNLVDGDLIDCGIRLQEARGRSYIPATAANEAALRGILERMDALRDGLADILGQARVVQSLVRVDGALSLLALERSGAHD